METSSLGSVMRKLMLAASPSSLFVTVFINENLSIGSM